jgi:PiT family inorganic phosphate transporter
MSITVLVVVIVVVALAFDYTNGFHDSANAIATTISTKALTPRVALVMAALANVVGALISTKVAATVGSGIIDAPEGRDGLMIILAALLGAIAWNLGTRYFGLPSSSSHALIGGLIGAPPRRIRGGELVGCHRQGRRADGGVTPDRPGPGLPVHAGRAVDLPANASKANRRFRWAQVASSGAMAFGHGTQDAQKTMGVIALTLTVSGHLEKGAGIPLWVILSAAGAISPAPTRVAGGSCGRSAGASSRSRRPARSPRKPSPVRSCCRPQASDCPCRRPTSSRRR